MILANPETRLIQHYLIKKRKLQSIYQDHRSSRDTQAITLDGKTISLFANIELPEDLDSMSVSGAEGVGLYRTEFLFMNREQLPTEEEHFESYLQILKKLDGKLLTIRTLDLGADKQIDCDRVKSDCTNPALGLRAIRLCLHDPDIFMPQLRAILRASAHGNVRIMLPMITNVQEVIQIRQQIQAAQQQLEQEGYDYDPAILVGGMIEVPAAAMNASMLCPLLDFISIGTNDLIQYTLAIDRVDDEVNYLYDPLNPAVLRLISIAITAAHASDTPVTMCGEMAGDPAFTKLLLGMGLDCFSMHPNALAEVKYCILNSSVNELTPEVTALLESRTFEDFHAKLDLITRLH